MPTTKAKKSTKKTSAKAAARPKMSEETRAQLARGRKLTIKVQKGSTFRAMLKEIERRLVIDKGIIGPKGCAPCHSGVDFTVVGQEVINPG
jgi:hypothetical protein